MTETYSELRRIRPGSLYFYKAFHPMELKCPSVLMFFQLVFIVKYNYLVTVFDTTQACCWKWRAETLENCAYVKSSSTCEEDSSIKKTGTGGRKEGTRKG
jgi:hypothetical protein